MRPTSVAPPAPPRPHAVRPPAAQLTALCIDAVQPATGGLDEVFSLLAARRPSRLSLLVFRDSEIRAWMQLEGSPEVARLAPMLASRAGLRLREVERTSLPTQHPRCQAQLVRHEGVQARRRPIAPLLRDLGRAGSRLRGVQVSVEAASLESLRGSLGWLEAAAALEAATVSQGAATTSTRVLGKPPLDQPAGFAAWARGLVSLEVTLFADEIESEMRAIDLVGSTFGDGGWSLSLDRALPPLLLPAEQLATLLPLPSINDGPHGLASFDLPPLLPARSLPSQGVLLGLCDDDDGVREVRLPDDVTRQHIVVSGATGTGKTTLLRRLAESAIEQRSGAVFVVEPHGDLCHALVASLPEQHRARAVVLDLGDPDHLPGLNPLEVSSEQERELAIGMLDQFFLGQFGPEIWGPRIQDAFRNLAMLASLDSPDNTLLDVVPLLQLHDNARLRERLQHTARCASNPALSLFIDQLLARANGDGSARELTPYFRAKFSALLDNPTLRCVLGQRTTLDIGKLIHDRSIVFFHLNKARISTRAASLLGSVLLAEILKALLRSGQLPPGSRPPLTLVVDEFQNFVTHSVADMLSEARKFGLSLAVGLQHLEQLDGRRMGTVGGESLRSAVLGNCGTVVSFRVGAGDAEVLARQLGAKVAAPQLVALPDRHAIARVAGHPPFVLRTAAPRPPLEGDHADLLAARSRAALCRPRVDIEQAIKRRFMAHLGHEVDDSREGLLSWLERESDGASR